MYTVLQADIIMCHIISPVCSDSQFALKTIRCSMTSGLVAATVHAHALSLFHSVRLQSVLCHSTVTENDAAGRLATQAQKDV